MHGLTQEENNLRLEIIDKICNNPKESIAIKPEFESLIDKNVVIAEKGTLVSIYPISLQPTNKLVYTKKSATPVYAMCAIDAIGVHYTIHEAITIKSEDALTHVPIYLTVKNGQMINQNDQDVFVLYKAITQKENCNLECCPYIHFFTRQQNIKDYLEQVQFKGPYQILNLDEANDIAKSLFHYQQLECGPCCQSF
ncbi:TPA: organomercurial lyase [Staphylococcus pseudintermedius]